MKVTVKDGQVETANRILKKRMQRAGIFIYLQKNKHHVTPSQIRVEQKAEKIKTIRRYLSFRMKKEGY